MSGENLRRDEGGRPPRRSVPRIGHGERAARIESGAGDDRAILGSTVSKASRPGRGRDCVNRTGAFRPSPRAYAAAARRQGVELDLAEVQASILREFPGCVEGDDGWGPPLDRRGERAATKMAGDRCGMLAGDRRPRPGVRREVDHFVDLGVVAAVPGRCPGHRGLRSAGIGLCVASNFDGTACTGSRLASDALRDWAAEPLVILLVGYRSQHEPVLSGGLQRVWDSPGTVFCSRAMTSGNDVVGPTRLAGLRSAYVGPRAGPLNGARPRPGRGSRGRRA